MPATIYKLMLDITDFQVKVAIASGTFDKATKKFYDDFKRVIGAGQEMTSAWAGAFKNVALSAGIGFAAIIGGTVVAASAVGKYDEAVRRLTLYMEDQTGSMEAAQAQTESMSQTFIELSSIYPIAATEIAEGAITLAKATNWTATEIETALVPAVQAAVWTGDDLNMILKAVVGTISAFQMPASRASEVIAKITVAANMAMVDVSDFATSLQYVASTAHFTGVSFEEVISALAAVSNAFIAPSRAGAGMRNTLIGIIESVTETQEGATRLQDVLISAGVSQEKINEVFGSGRIEFTKVLELFEEANITMIQVGQIFDILGKRSADVFISLIGQGENYADILEAVRNAQATTAERAWFMAQSLSGLLVVFQNQLMAAMQQPEVLEALRQALWAIVQVAPILGQFLAELVFRMAAMAPTLMTKLIPALEDLLRALPDIVVIAGALADVFVGIVWVVSRLGPVLVPLIGAFIALKLILPFVSAAMATYQFMVLQSIYANQLLAAGAIRVTALQYLSSAAFWTTALAVGGLTIGIWGLIESLKTGNEAARWISSTLIALSGVVLGMKVACWLGFEAWTAYWAAATVGVAVGVILASLAVAWAWMAQEQERSNEQQEEMNRLMQKYKDQAFDATQSTSSMGDAFQGLKSDMSAYYELFLVLTQDTEGYILTMGFMAASQKEATGAIIETRKAYSDLANIEFPEITAPGGWDWGKAYEAAAAWTGEWIWPGKIKPIWEYFQMGGIIYKPTVAVVGDVEPERIIREREYQEIIRERGGGGEMSILKGATVIMTPETNLDRFAKVLGRKIAGRL